MIDYQTFCQLRMLFDTKHLKPSQIAAELKLSRPTVQKWVHRPTYERRSNPQRPSKLDAFKGQIVGLLERHPYTAQQIADSDESGHLFQSISDTIPILSDSCRSEATL